MTSIALLYSPFPDANCATVAARALLEAGHVLCCNILPAAQSLYWWQGRIETTTEHILIAKTSTAHAEQAVHALTALHPHACPAILHLAAEANEPFGQYLHHTLNDFIPMHEDD